MRKSFLQAVALILALMASLLGPVSAQAAPSASPDVVPFIIGGEDATEQYGMVSGQQLDGKHRCGGVLIRPDAAITAAHCVVFGAFEPGMVVRVGSKDRTQGGQLIQVERTEILPNFDMMKAGKDLALVFLKEQVRDRSLVMAFARNEGPVGTQTRIAGWGRHCQDPANPACATLPINLKQLDTLVLRDKKCVQYDPIAKVPAFDSRDEICMGPESGEHEMACNGDSGGGMFKRIWHKGKRIWALIAITSRDGDDLYPVEGRYNYCAYSPTGKPGVGVYTSAIAHLDWIRARLAARSMPALDGAQGPVVPYDLELVG